MPFATDHPLWSPYRDLRSAGRRKMGEQEVFIAEGRILVEDLLRAGRAGHLVVHSVATTPALAEQLKPQMPSTAVLLVAPEEELHAVAGFPFHRGVLACAEVPPQPPEEALLSCDRLLVLPRLDDAENLGLLLRSAAALGLDGVLLGKGPDLWSRRTLRVSMGAAWRLPAWRMEEPGELLARWRGRGGEIVGAALGPGSEVAHSWQPAPRCALVLGPEGSGLDPAWLLRCDRRVVIPMAHAVDSLNVAAAGAILMYQMTGHREGI
ncbi:MAG: RNA methyltransferase [Acidobacteria bacterium]|nr:RNA methyltransferase [Acidobacteriota bacterium]